MQITQLISCYVNYQPDQEITNKCVEQFDHNLKFTRGKWALNTNQLLLKALPKPLRLGIQVSISTSKHC